MIKYRAKIDYSLAEELKYDPYIAQKYMFKPPKYWDKKNFITCILYGEPRNAKLRVDF